VEIFLVIGCVGVALLLVSLVLGDLLDGLLDFGPDVLSSAAIAGFLGALGFVGAIAQDEWDNVTLSVGLGALAGLVVGAGVGLVSVQLGRGGDDANVRTGDLTGRDATVINAIPADGYGEVTLTVAGQITRLNARAAAPLAAGTPVSITAVLSPTAVQVAARA
jgi:membrane protein implicated in regulation of membrane protease activity